MRSLLGYLHGASLVSPEQLGLSSKYYYILLSFQVLLKVQYEPQHLLMQE